jgi:hypothetical protein
MQIKDNDMASHLHREQTTKEEKANKKDVEK